MSARRLPVAARALLTLVGVAVTSVLLVLSATEVAIATQGERVAPWVALLLFAGAIVLGWLTLWVAAGRNPLGALDSTWARTPRRLVAARILLALSALLLILFFLGLPMPPRRWREMSAAIAILALFVAAAYGAVTVAHRDPRGRYVALALGAWMTSQLVRSTYVIAHTRVDPNVGPGVAWSYLLSWTCYGAAIVAALCVLSLRGAWPPRNTPD